MDAIELVERVRSVAAAVPLGEPGWDERMARAALREIVAAAGVSRVAMIGHADDIERKWPGDKIAALLRALAEGGKDA